MTSPVAPSAERKASSPARIGWMLAAVILLSFAFGAILYSGPEQRAQKLEEIKNRYQAKQQHYRNLSGHRP